MPIDNNINSPDAFMGTDTPDSDPSVITEDFWFEHYKPIENDIDPNSMFDGCFFETYGPEYDKVLAAEPNKVWTLLDDGDKQFIRAGWCFVNRLAYFITEVPWTDDSMEVHWDQDYRQDAVMDEEQEEGASHANDN